MADERTRLSIDELNAAVFEQESSFGSGFPIDEPDVTLAIGQDFEDAGEQAEELPPRERILNIAYAAELLNDRTIDALVVPVNLRGAMGAGFALAVSEKYPEITAPYQRAALARDLDVGKPWIFDRGATSENPRFLACVATKRDYKDASRLDDVVAGIRALPQALHNVRAASRSGNAPAIATVGIPGLGTGLGGLEQADVFPHIEAAFDNTGFSVVHGFSEFQKGLDFETELAETAQRRLFTEPAIRPATPARGFYKSGWLSNFNEFETPLIEDGIAYPTPEHYFQAAQCIDESDKRRLTTMTPAEAKKAVAGMERIPREEFDTRSTSVMRTALEHRFAPGTLACDQLMATGTRELVEWNNWNDRTWGRDIATGAGENRLGTLLMDLRASHRERGITPNEQVLDPDHNRGLQKDEVRSYAAAGSRSLPRNHSLARFAEQTATRLERLGYTLNSGAAEGADRAFERGVTRADHKAIFRPEYDRDKRLPPGYRIVDGPAAREARTIAAAVTTNFATMSTFGQDLHTRNVFQVLGADLKTPVEFIAAIPKKFDGRVTGTWATMAIAKAHGIPVYNLSESTERRAFVEKLRGMELDAGRPWHGPDLVAEHAPVRGHLPAGPTRAPSPTPVAVNVVNVRSLAPGTENALYVGRTRSIPDEFNIESAHDLSNPFIVGRDGMTGACAEKFWDRFADQLGTSTKLQDRIGQLVERAADKGSIDLACHGCNPCHADAIAVAIMDGLGERGFGVTTNIPERVALVQPPTRPELEVAEELAKRGLTYAQQTTPWRKIEGEVLYASDREAIVHIGQGVTRTIDQRRLENPVEIGTYATLVQSERGLERLSADRTLTNTR